MTDKYGARKGAWRHFAEVHGLLSDLLPVVSDQRVAISPASAISEVGKTPSMLNFRGEAIGIKDWTSMQANAQKLVEWEQRPEYGICIQTRRWRAIDIDVPDLRKAKLIVEKIEEALPHISFVRRWREGTGKVLMPFIYRHPLTKHVVDVSGGIVEVLADGQQFVAEGMHPTGVRYNWSGTGPGRLPAVGEVPELDEQDFAELWDTVVKLFATGEPRIARAKRAPGDVDLTGAEDPVAAWLEENWDVHDTGEEGQLYIRCPFEHEHTTDSGATGTAYFAAGTGGYAQGHFVCLHAHCAGRDDVDFREACGYEADQFPDLSHELVEEEPQDGGEGGDSDAGTAGGAAAGGGGAELPVPLTDRQKRVQELMHGSMREILQRAKIIPDSKGKIDATATFVTRALKAVGITNMVLAFDDFTAGVMWSRPDVDPPRWRIFEDRHYVELRMRLEQVGFKDIGVERLRSCVHFVAYQQRIDTAQEWLARKQWDGVPRVEGFLSTYLGLPDTAYHRAVSRYIWTALAGRVVEPGVKVDMVPVLQGEEGLRKSTMVSCLVPSEELFGEINLMHRDDDTSRLMRGKLAIELAELRGLQTRDAEDILSFITRRHESWVPKYMEMAVKFPRRCLMIGTTNRGQFLTEKTGRRRWLPLAVTQQIDSEAVERDRDQLWAEGALLFGITGVDFAEAEELAREEHARFEERDEKLPVLARWLLLADVDGVAPVDKPYQWSVVDAAMGAFGIKPGQLRKTDETAIGLMLSRSLKASKKRDRNAGCSKYAVSEEEARKWI